MNLLEIKLKPLDAYFFGGERNMRFEDNNHVQLAQRRPYFISSNALPSQSALFGALRYLGIESPDASFGIDGDVDNIGERSYDLTDLDRNDYGRILNLSPLFLVCDDPKAQTHYLPAPRSRHSVELKDGKADYMPFAQYTQIQTIDGERWLPEEYNEKTAFDGADFICLETGKLRGDLISSQVRVGINRTIQNNDDTEEERKGFFNQVRVGINRTIQNNGDTKEERKGFFKKEYKVLDKDFSFLFYAAVSDGPVRFHSRPVFMGQGRTPFEAVVTRVSEMPRLKEGLCIFPTHASIGKTDGADQTPEAGIWLTSDLYYMGDIRDLKKNCDLMIAASRDYRTFTTRKKADQGRYEKGKEALRLIQAGGAFLFFGDEAAQRMENFEKALEDRIECKHARIAGFNHWIDSSGNATWIVGDKKED